MTAITFGSERKIARLHDPRKNFELTEIESEIRYDPLTGDSGRICHFSLKTAPPAELERLATDTVAHCPFCSPALRQVTPRFPDELLAGGRLARGDAVLVPNLFPYDDVSAVAVMSKDHFHPMKDMPTKVIEDGVGLARDFMAAIRGKVSGDGKRLYGIATWNYMPAAGASQIHPHMQAVVTTNPGNRARRELTAEREYLARNGRYYAEDLLTREREQSARWIGMSGTVAWYVPFSPTGVLGDCCAVFPGRSTLTDLIDRDIADFARGLQTVLDYFAGIGLWSFNLCFFPDAWGADPGAHWLTVRIVPRLYLNPQTHCTDVAHLQLLLEERFSMVYPEETAEGIRKIWALRKHA